MGRDSRKKKPVTTQVPEPEVRRFLWDSLKEARNGALRNIGLTGDLPQTEAPAPQFGNFLDIRPTPRRPPEAFSAGPGPVDR